MSAKVIHFPFSPERDKFRFSPIEKTVTLDRLSEIATGVIELRGHVPTSNYHSELSEPFIRGDEALVGYDQQRTEAANGATDTQPGGLGTVASLSDYARNLAVSSEEPTSKAA